MLPDAVL
jgi:hypothetical protein